MNSAPAERAECGSEAGERCLRRNKAAASDSGRTARFRAQSLVSVGAVRLAAGLDPGNDG